MNDKILVCYKSVTGFTKQYAEMIADELDCTLMDIRNVTVETVSQYDIVVFGGRCYAGTIDTLKKAKKLIAKSSVKTFIVFATGATPNTEKDALQEMWTKNLTSEEFHNIPHFYMQGGLRYEKMPLPEKLMMKTFSAIMKRKIKNQKDITEEDKVFQHMISNSYDISSNMYIEPLISFLKKEKL